MKIREERMRKRFAASAAFTTDLRGCRAGVAAFEYVLLGALIAAAAHFGLEHWPRASGAFGEVGRSLDEERPPDTPVDRASAGAPEEAEAIAFTTEASWIGASILVASAGGLLFRLRIGRTSLDSPARRPAASKPRHRPKAIDVSRARYAEKRLRILGEMLRDDRKLLAGEMRIRDLMTEAPKVVAPDTKVGDLRKLVRENRFHHVLICDAERRLLGVISDRDLHSAADSTSAAEVMSDRPTSVSSDSLVNDAITVILSGHISSLPVVDDGRVVGIFTTTDAVMALQCAMRAFEHVVQELRTCAAGSKSEV
jgi:CBS domain-containing protein